MIGLYCFMLRTNAPTLINRREIPRESGSQNEAAVRTAITKIPRPERLIVS